MVLRRIGPLSLAKLSALLYGILGVFVGGIFSLVSMFAAAFRPQDAGPFAAIMGVGAVVWFPLLYGCMGFLGGLIGAALYNLLAGWIGGIRVELQETPPAAP